MNRGILRSVVAVFMGWVVVSAGCVITLIALVNLNPEAFQAGVRSSTVWWLIIQSILGVYSIVGGFVTATIAQRSEMRHAMGLVLLLLAISALSTFMGRHTPQVTTWQTVAGVILVIPTTLLGGWLRMKLRLLPESRSRALTIAMDGTRLLIAATVSLVTFVTVVCVGFVVGGSLTLLVPFAYGTQALVFSFFASLVLGSLLSAVVFTKIKGSTRDGLTPTLRADAEDDGE